MIDSFLKVAYAQELKRQESAELTEMLKRLPVGDLRKLASGSTVAELYPHLEKLADCDSEPHSFLERFKGTALFDQAVALEQEELQLEMLRQQRREQERAAPPTPDDTYAMSDKIRLKKKMLELELAKQEGGASQEVPGQPAQGAGAPGPVPAEGVQDNAQGLAGGVAKAAAATKTALSPGRIGSAITSAVEHGAFTPERAQKLKQLGGSLANKAQSMAGGLPLGGTANKLMTQGATAMHEAQQYLPRKLASVEEKVAFADELGRTLARADFEKAAHAALLTDFGTRAGAVMAKTALPNLGALGGMASKALGWAAKNPSAAGAIGGAALGAGGGALAGGPGHRLGGALTGAAGGAALGGTAGHVAGGGGGALGQKARDLATQGMGKLRSAVGAAPQPQMQLPGM